mgnify:CR=1 FL=1
MRMRSRRAFSSTLRCSSAPLSSISGVSISSDFLKSYSGLKDKELHDRLIETIIGSDIGTRTLDLLRKTRTDLVQELEQRTSTTTRVPERACEVVHCGVELLLIDVRLCGRELQRGVGVDG